MTTCSRRTLRLRSIAVLFLSVAAAAVGLFPTRVEAQVTRKGVVIVGKGSGKCIQVRDESTASGAPIVQSICGSDSTTWKLVPSSAYFHVVASHSGGCLSVPQGDASSDRPVVQSACSASRDQLWSVQPSGSFYRLVAVASGRCLHVKGGSQDSGVALIQGPCGKADSELWMFGGGFVGPRDRVRMVNSRSGLCAELARGGAPTLAPCKRTAARDQMWTIQRGSDGYRIAAEGAGKCLAARAGAAEAAPLSPSSCGRTADAPAGGPWRVDPPGPSGRGFAIVDRQSARCLDLAGDGRSLVERTCDGSPAQAWQLAAEHELGSWSAVVPLPLVPVGAAALRNGKVLFWSAYDAFTFGGDNGKTQTALFDPVTGSLVSIEVADTQHDMFCPGTALLGDGRLLVNGGSSSSRTSIYNPVTGVWTASGVMNVPRGYNSDVTLASGKVLTIGGSWSGGQGGKLGEVWSSSTGAWVAETGIPATPMTAPDPAGVYRGDNHAWLFATGAGKVFHAGPSLEMNWFDTAGSGSFESAGTRGTDSYSMCGSAVMYDVNRILKLGGAPAYDSAGALVKAYVIDINAGVAVTPTGSLAFARTYQNSVALPDGRVFVAGGQAVGAPFSDAQSVLAGEIWSEAANGFTTVASAAVPRNYHSIALLLPDARVLVGGGGLCGAGCEANHPDLEFYSPGYLFDPSGQPAVRPVITAAPTTARYNTTISVTTSAAVASFVFIRMGSVTHTVNNDQRRVPAVITGQVGTTYTVATPANSGVAPPGFYMLFAIDSSGVPSVAKILRVRS
ncbi:MAG TPA: RICIN domain-containing protein [Kofleriaceae bacterium]|nr:RICIN domain-containing protein [Kofleriaceae bacterium]